VSSLKTYTRPDVETPFTRYDHPSCICHFDPKDAGNTLTPGDWVYHAGTIAHTGDRSSLGIVIAVEYESNVVRQITVLWSKEPKHFTGFGQFALPLVRSTFPLLRAPQLVSIQPMTIPVGGIFYLDYKYPGMETWLDRRCNSGPAWVKMIWKGIRWLITRTQSRLSSFRSWLRSAFGKRSTPVGISAESKLLMEKAVGTELMKKWSHIIEEENDTHAR